VSAEFSRRRFLAGVAMLPLPDLPARAQIINLGEQCILPESLAAYQSALPQSAVRGSTLHYAAPQIIPGSSIDEWASRAPVLLESACGLLARPARYGPYMPYVEFTWPVRALIREFFPYALQPRTGDHIIARYSGAPVGFRRRNLIVLASPIGPALGAGDRDAHRWLSNVLRWMHTHSFEA
jgi:hypothetical protein